jgi:hypothetical protein
MTPWPPPGYAPLDRDWLICVPCALERRTAVIYPSHPGPAEDGPGPRDWDDLAGALAAHANSGWHPKPKEEPL